MLHVRRKSPVVPRNQGLHSIFDGFAVRIHDWEVLDDLQANGYGIFYVHKVGLSPA